ncbi:MAG: hypothetical protein VX519_06265, partial [Myxococcota bacterium]|nr:hypothetical protein [Myxococcota bacterium]
AEETAYQPSRLLSVGPVPGAPLRPGTQYAAVVTTELAETHPEQAKVWSPGDPRHTTWKSVKETLSSLDLSLEQIAIGSVFTTQDPVAELAEYADWSEQNLPTPNWDQQLTPGFSTQHFSTGVGELSLPLFQHGEKPYSTTGGGFERDEAGAPLLAEMESMPFTLSVPTDAAPPEPGWPVVIWAHGTGGDHTNCCDNTAEFETARVLANASIAVLSVPLPLHGERATAGTIPELHSFNPMNAEAARTNFRQGALDVVSLSRGLASRAHTLELDGTPHTLDPDRVFLAGHSHGGITSAIAGAFIGNDVSAMFLSAAGGGMSTVLTQRSEPIDLEALIHQTLALEGHERLQPLHPVATLIQTVTDVTDPINYARYWKDEEAWFSTQPLSVLMSEGLLDEPTPPAAMEALAAAGGLPQLTPVHQPSLAHELLGILEQSPPSSTHLPGYDVSLVTGGLAQFPDLGHFVVFSHPPAARLFQEFFETATVGSATIIEFDGE